MALGGGVSVISVPTLLLWFPGSCQTGVGQSSCMHMPCGLLYVQVGVFVLVQVFLEPEMVTQRVCDRLPTGR